MNRIFLLLRHTSFWMLLILTNLLLFSTTGFTQTNLITNSGFEDKTTGWSVWGATLSTTADAHSGSLAALVSNRKNPWDAIVRDLSKVLENGQTYTLSAWVKLPKPAVNFRATLNIKAGGADTYNGLLWTNSPVIGSYTFYSQTFTVKWTGSLTAANLYFETESVGGIYSDYLLDDVQLVKSVPVVDIIQQGPGLKDIKSSLLIGGCVGEGAKNYFTNAAAKAQVLKDCNTVTVQCYPGWGRWDETRRHVYHVDEFSTQVQEMKKQKMNVTAHMLLGWDQYFPAWYKENDFPADTLEAIMQSWLRGIIQYKGNDTLVDVWNVVNEAISWNGRGGYWPENNPDHMNACEMQRMGYEPDVSGLTGVQKPNTQHPVYIRKAFEYARTLTKKKLELRDSGIEFPTDSKYNAFYELAVHLKKMNAPIDVIGFQTHIDLERQYDWEGYVKNIRRYVDLGYQVNIPEVDIGDVEKSWSEEKANLQKLQYYRLVTSAIRGGASDMQTWGFIDDGWRAGQKAFPYTNNFEAKPAYYGIKEALTDMSAILYWEMEDPVDRMVHDVMKGHNDGTLYDFSAPSGSSGFIGRSIKFTHNYITTGKLSDSIPGDLTFSCFIRTSANQLSTIAEIAKEEGSGLILGIKADGKVFLNAGEAGLPADLVSPKAINDDSWHFIALQRDSTTYRLYVDSSTPVASAQGTIPKLTHLVVGATKDGLIRYEGLMDEVKLYNTAIEEASFTRSRTPFAPYKLKATVYGLKTVLSWTDESSTEQGFLIERKTKDSDWQEVGRVGANIYSYIDALPGYSTEYSYRVSAYNSMGTSEPSIVAIVTSPADPKTGLSEHSGDRSQYIFPNPVKDQFTLISTGNPEARLYDMQGKLMLLKKNCAPAELFDMAGFSKGIYFLKMYGDSKSDVIKLVKK
ncbi:MAG: endo-1,4-beta-xylanase [Candidatus Saccharibacteria bacterium]